MFRTVCLATMLAIGSASLADDMTDGIIGTYKGRASHMRSTYPVTTTFHRDALRGVAGSYVIEYKQTLQAGDLTNFRMEGEYTAVFSWSDIDGTGTVRMLFSEDFRTFTGYWGGGRKNSPVSFFWNGVKQ